MYGLFIQLIGAIYRYSGIFGARNALNKKIVGR
jgi:hypothetical protein